MFKIKTQVIGSALLAFYLNSNTAHADNIFQRLFGHKSEEAKPLPANSFDVQAQPGIKVSSSGKPIGTYNGKVITDGNTSTATGKTETRSYLTPKVKDQLGSTKKSSSSSKNPNSSSNDSTNQPGNSPINVDSVNGQISYDPTDGIRNQMIDKVNFLKEQAGNSAFFNSLYTSTIMTFSMRKAFFESADGSYKNIEQLLITDHLSDPSKFKLELSDLQLAFFNSMVKFISENPMLGGKPLRGFEPKIWNALVQVLLSNTIPMTPDGVLLLPYNDQYEFRFADYKNDRGTLVNSTLVLVDRRGNLLDEMGRPIIPRSFKTLGEPAQGPNAQAGAYEDTAQDWSFMDQLQQVAPNLVNAFTGQALFIQNKPQFDSFLQSQAIFSESLGFVDCFKLWLSRQNPDISVADCFKQGGSTLGHEIEVWAKDGGQTFLRGGIAGAGLSKLFSGINVTAGFTYGGLTNIFGFMYNRYLKKEKITPTQINNLVSFVSSHTFKQGQWGVIQPGTDKGLWGVTHTGLITRYRTMNVRTFVGRDADGTIRYAVKEKNVRLDLAGQELNGTSTVQFNDVFNPSNQYKIKKAALQMQKSGEENGLAGLIDPQLGNSDQPMTVPDSATFMKENALNWVSDPEKTVKKSDSPATRDDKLIKNENETVKVESVKPAAKKETTSSPKTTLPLPKESSPIDAITYPSTRLIPTAVDPNEKSRENNPQASTSPAPSPSTETTKTEAPAISKTPSPAAATAPAPTTSTETPATSAKENSNPKIESTKAEAPATGTPKIEIPGINLPPQQ